MALVLLVMRVAPSAWRPAMAGTQSVARRPIERRRSGAVHLSEGPLRSLERRGPLRRSSWWRYVHRHVAGVSQVGNGRCGASADRMRVCWSALTAGQPDGPAWIDTQ
jgi:hypothetical protein